MTLIYFFIPFLIGFPPPDGDTETYTLYESIHSPTEFNRRISQANTPVVVMFIVGA